MGYSRGERMMHFLNNLSSYIILSDLRSSKLKPGRLLFYIVEHVQYFHNT